MRRAARAMIAIAVVVSMPLLAQSRPGSVPRDRVPVTGGYSVPRDATYQVTPQDDMAKAQRAGDPLPNVDVSLDKKPGGQSYRGTMAADGTIQLPQVPPGTYTLVITFKDAVPVAPAPAPPSRGREGVAQPTPQPAGGVRPNAKSYFESRSNVANAVAPNTALPQGEWRTFTQGDFPYVYNVTGTNVRRVNESIVRTVSDVRIEQNIYIEGNQPVAIKTSVRRAPANLQVVPERSQTYH